MKLSSTAFNKHLAHMGQKVKWRRSYACACLNHQSGNPDPQHQLCNGKGRIWDPPIETVTGIPNQTVQAQWAALGMFEAGDLVLSIPAASALWNAGMYDRVLLLNSTTVFSQPFIRGAPSEKVIFPVCKIDRCFWLSGPNRGTIVEGGIPTVSETGALSWASGEPPPGATYSLTGTKYDEYFIWGQFPSDRNEHSGEALPRRVVARKFDLFSR